MEFIFKVLIGLSIGCVLGYKEIKILIDRFKGEK